jgi:hypothetical protein
MLVNPTGYAQVMKNIVRGRKIPVQIEEASMAGYRA